MCDLLKIVEPSALAQEALQTIDLKGERNGAQGRNRTSDTAIFNRMLYQLSYLGSRVGMPKKHPRERSVL